MSAHRSSAPSLRRPALDGLRGLAAVIVVIHHSLLVSPALADGYRTAQVGRPLRLNWLLLYTPLHLAWAGGEAVLVFFVLSGLVLAMPYAAGRGDRWRAYYPQRLLRLYLPIGASVGLAFVLIAVVPRHAKPASSWWLAAHVSPVGLREAVHNALVVRGTTWMNSALWSLRWEIYFSALLPMFVLLLVRVHRWPAARVLTLLPLLAYGNHSGHQSLVYLPIFGLGVIMSQQLPALDRAGERFDRLSPSVRRDVTIGVGLLLVSRWWLLALPYAWSTPRRYVYTGDISVVLTVVGACLLVWLFSSTRTAGAAGRSRPAKWLGKRSFSLYLVHEPIVVTVAYLLGGTTDALLVLVLALPLSLAAAEVFSRYIEMPSHRLARAAGRLLSPSSDDAALKPTAVALQQPVHL
jgi:peptidoglycan/LPS O-acetylase OafA/YrhL